MATKGKGKKPKAEKGRGGGVTSLILLSVVLATFESLPHFLFENEFWNQTRKLPFSDEKPVISE